MKATTSTAGSSRSMNFVTEAVAEDVVLWRCSLMGIRIDGISKLSKLSTTK